MSLVLKKIEKSYPEFDLDLTFTAEKGMLLTLLGPSGCGKTTTLHLIAGFISPDSGTMSIGSEDVTARPPHLRKLGVVFQDYALFPNMNVFGNIAFGLRMHGWPRDRIQRRVQDLLDLVRLPGYEHRIVTQLSGGEQQRVALARALAPEPRLLLLDEPLSALDAKLRHELRFEIKRIQRELGLTTVYVTHDQEEALAISDRVVVMQAGQIEQIGTPFEVFNRPRSSFVADFMGMSNSIEGRVISCEGDQVLLDTKEGSFTVHFTHPLPRDAKVTFVFRPEKGLPVAKTNKSHTNMLVGRITSSEYLGESTILKVTTNAGEYSVKLQGAPALLTNTPAQVYIHPDDLWILEREIMRDSSNPI